MDLFAVSAPGLEPFTAQELTQLQLRPQAAASSDEKEGGWAFQGNRRALYRANLHLRTASRILVRVGEFYAASFSELRAKAARLPWENYVAHTQLAVAVRATCHKSRLYHSSAVAERIAGAIGDRLGRSLELRKPAAAVTAAEAEGEAAAEGSTEAAAPLIIARLVHDRCTLSLDSSGALLHQRGYRLATAKAPLRETLAAGLLLASGWDPNTPLLDPFCGSGTIVIEAALLARQMAPGRARRFAFMDWPDFDRPLWEALLAEAEARVCPAAAQLLGSDRDAGAIAAAQANAARAGVAESVALSRGAVSDLAPPPGPGWLVTNPPYGVRVRGQADLRNLYARLGQVLRVRCPGWRVALLTSELRLAQSTGLAFDARESVSLINGGLKVKLVRSQVPASSGSMTS